MLNLSEAQLLLLVEMSPAEAYLLDDLKTMSPQITPEEIEGLENRGYLVSGNVRRSYYLSNKAEAHVAQCFVNMLQALKSISYAAQLRRHAEIFNLANKALNWKGND